MFEKLKDKNVKCVYKDGTQEKAIVGILLSVDDRFILINTRGNDVYINIDSITSLFERGDNYGQG